MIKKYCDRCAKEIEFEAPRKHVKEFKFEGQVQVKYFWWIQTKWFQHYEYNELCKHCYREYKDIMAKFFKRGV